MKPATALLAFLWLSSFAAGQAESVALTHLTVIDVTGKPAKRDMTLVITGEHIAAMGKSGRVSLPKGSRVVNASGKYLIPGLWDMHVHTLSKGQAEQFFPLFIANGITGVRDMGGDLSFEQIADIKRRTQTQSGYGPRIIAAGPILEGSRPFWAFSMSVKDAGEGKDAVGMLAKNGADFLKVYNTLSREAYFGVAAEAKAKGVPFAGHVPEDVSPLQASRAGQKSIEHSWGLKIAVTRDPQALKKQRAEANDEEDPQKARDLFYKLNQSIVEQYDPGRALALFREFVANGTWQVPTLTVLRSYAWIHDASLRSDHRIAYMPRSIMDSWSQMGGKPDPRNDAMQKRLFRQNLELVAAMRRAGVNILAGTDTPNPYTYPGFSLHNELELLVQAGLSPAEALQTATISPARFLNLDDTLGTVEAGKIADLVLLDANPLENISNTQRIAAVVVSGRYLPKHKLEKMLSNARASAN
jgi:hypothetical protein